MKSPAQQLACANPMPVTIIIPRLPPSENQVERGKLRERIRLKKAWQEAVWLAARGVPPVKQYPVIVSVRVEFGPGQRRFDADNLAPAAKRATDQLKKMGILRGDSPGHVAEVRLGPCTRGGESRTIYTIEQA